ncbi:hypothetical protein [Spirosoma pulveris]
MRGTKIGLVNLCSSQAEAIHFAPTETKGGDRFLRPIADAIRQFKARATAEQAVLLGIGFGVRRFVFADGTVDQ